jgi:hypothetical protein
MAGSGLPTRTMWCRHGVPIYSYSTVSLNITPSDRPEFGDQTLDNDAAALAGCKQQSISPLPWRYTSVQSSAHDGKVISALHLLYLLAIRIPAREQDLLVRWRA